MKEKLLLFVSLALLAIRVNAQPKPYDFSDGKLFYKITNAETHEVYVVAEKGSGKYSTKLEGEITIPEQVASGEVEYLVTGIAKQAFYMCDGITKVAFPKSLRKINDKAFLGCHNLVAVTLPENVEKIGKWAFMSCAQLEEINVDSGNAYFSSVDGVLYNKDATKLIQCPCGKTGSFEIPATVKEIGRQAFYGCTNLKAMTIPGSVEKIGDDGFYACTRLRKIICEIVVPLAGDAMGAGVFEQVSTASVGGSCVLYVPKGSVESYSEASQWKKFAPNIKEISTTGVNSNTLNTFKAKGGNGEIIIARGVNGELVEIFDMAGRLVRIVKANSSEVSVPLPSGIYIVKCNRVQMKLSVK